jgi:4-amino-4-deoxy-L-arabinose transferase-like glycosyltransferase
VTTTAQPVPTQPAADLHAPADGYAGGGRPRRHLSALWRGRPDDPRWVRPSLLALLAATALLYLWRLGASGWANGFYSAAVQAGSSSWKAFFFGSFDSSSFITVDKPPASLWVMDISARIFGVNPWSILVPQALMGVASVGLLYATVRRRFTPTAGLLAGAVLAVTPAATLMFRYNNPDALLTLLLIGSAYAMVRALEGARTRWIMFAGSLVGLAFLTKMLQALVVVPGFALVYLYAAPTTMRRRIGQLAAAGVAVVVSAGWWVAAVTLIPAADRPYIGGSQHNSLLELIFGYNGFGRLTGQETGSVGGGGQTGISQWGPTGITRMFNTEFGGQVSWLIPAALVFLVGLLWLSRRLPRVDPRRAQVLLWGTWLLVTGLTFSLAKGIIHPYYAIALAPAIGALVGIGADATWRGRRHLQPRLVLATALALTSVWSWVLLDRSPTWHPSLRLLVLIGGLAAALAIAVAPMLRGRGAAAVAGTALVAALAGPTAYAVDTATTPHGGAIPSAGPAVQGSRFGGPGRIGAVGPGGAGGPGGPGGPGQRPPRAGGFGGPGARGGLGGLLDTATPSSALVTALKAGASGYTWVAAAVGSNSAAGVQIATGLPVMSIGGFNGTDPTPTLAQFQSIVAAGKVHYFLAGGGMRGGPGGGAASSGDITSWVEQNFTPVTIGGVTVYDLTRGS